MLFLKNIRRSYAYVLIRKNICHLYTLYAPVNTVLLSVRSSANIYLSPSSRRNIENLFKSLIGRKYQRIFEVSYQQKVSKNFPSSFIVIDKKI